MFLSCLNPAAGVEQYVVSLLPVLRDLGVDVTFCLATMPEPENQYYDQLRVDGFEVHYPRVGPFPIRGWSWPADAVLWICLPITVMLMAVDRLWRGRDWRASYRGIHGRLNNMLKPWLPDSTENLPTWLLLTWLWVRHRPDLVHVLRVDSVAGVHWALTMRLDLVYTEALEPGGDKFYPQLANDYRRLARLAVQIPTIVTQSERVRRAIETHWHTTQNVHVLPWVLTVPQQAEINFKRPSHSLVFGTAGRLSPEKCVETFLDAAELLKREYPDRAAFVVAGDGPVAGALREHASRLDLFDNVTFYGMYTRDSIARIFATFDVFVITSLTEGAPLAVIEAMAYGKPVIATDIAGTGELVIDGRTGFLIAPNSPQRLADAFRRFIQEPGLVREMGQAAQTRYSEAYSPHAGAQQLVALYEKIAVSQGR